jgi:hypothetical protein
MLVAEFLPASARPKDEMAGSVSVRLFFREYPVFRIVPCQRELQFSAVLSAQTGIKCKVVNKLT